MFSKGEIIVYGSSGVCEIIDITERVIAKQKHTYYVLKPKQLNQSSIFVPIDNEMLVSRIRKLYTEKEILGLIKESKDNDIKWDDDTNKRTREYHSIIATGDLKQIVSIIRKINAFSKKKESSDFHFSKSDERTYKMAMNVLYNEISYVMDITQEELEKLINS